MQVFDANKLFQGDDPIVLTKTKHTGPVRALDFNCFRVSDLKYLLVALHLFYLCIMIVII